MASQIEFDGWNSHHELDYLPQVAAMKDRTIIQTVLSRVEYWKASALERG